MPEGALSGSEAAMLFDFRGYDIFIRPGVTDMRGGHRRLACIITAQMGMDPFSRSVFAFCGRGRNIIKLFVWDGGYWVMTCRLVRGTFAWPCTEEEARRLSLEDLRRLLSGQDVFRSVERQGERLVF